jgi:VanZ family protein
MLKLIKRLLERNAYSIAIGLTIVIVFLSLVQTSSLIEVVKVSDKSLHSFAYFGLALSWFFAVKSSHTKMKQKIIIALFVLLLSVLLEYLQGTIIDNRVLDYFDIVANIIGIVIAMVFFRPLLHVYKTI